MKYEYKFKVWAPDYTNVSPDNPPNFNGHVEYLNQKGAEGWELCGVVPHGYGVYNFFFKRLIQ